MHPIFFQKYRSIENMDYHSLIEEIGRVQSFFCQQMHFLLKHKMLQFIPKISLYTAATCFGPSGLPSGSMQRNLAKVTVTVEIIS